MAACYHQFLQVTKIRGGYSGEGGGGLYSAGYGAPSEAQPQLPAYWLSGRKPHSCCDMSILQYWGLSLSLSLLQKIFNSQMHRFCCSPVVLLLFSSSPDSHRR